MEKYDKSLITVKSCILSSIKPTLNLSMKYKYQVQCFTCNSSCNSFSQSAESESFLSCDILSGASVVAMNTKATMNIPSSIFSPLLQISAPAYLLANYNFTFTYISNVIFLSTKAGLHLLPCIIHHISEAKHDRIIWKEVQAPEFVGKNGDNATSYST